MALALFAVEEQPENAGHSAVTVIVDPTAVKIANSAGQLKPDVRSFRSVAVSVKRVCAFGALATFTALVFSAKRRGDWDRQWREFARLTDTNAPEAGAITVAAGDSFWSIAEQLVMNHLGRTPTDDEVLEPWLALIDSNRDRLLYPDDPDLIYPGQVLRLPPAECLPALRPREDQAEGEAS